VTASAFRARAGWHGALKFLKIINKRADRSLRQKDRTAPMQRFAIAGENRMRSNRYFHPEFGSSRLRRGPFSMLFGIGSAWPPVAALRIDSRDRHSGPVSPVQTGGAVIDADDLPPNMKRSFDALVSAEAAFKAELENLLKKQGHMPDDKCLLIRGSA
jgi:hypothetical protein